LTDLTKIETKILVSKQKSKTKEAKVRVKQKKLETLTKTKILFKTKKALHFLSGRGLSEFVRKKPKEMLVSFFSIYGMYAMSFFFQCKKKALLWFPKGTKGYSKVFVSYFCF